MRDYKVNYKRAKRSEKVIKARIFSTHPSSFREYTKKLMAHTESCLVVNSSAHLKFRELQVTPLFMKELR